MGAERPIPARFHNPLEEEGLSVPGGGLGDIPTPAEEEEEDDPLTLDHGEEKVDDAGDLLALMTPGRRKFDGELGPERPNSITISASNGYVTLRYVPLGSLRLTQVNLG